jgi:hypothetical protein
VLPALLSTYLPAQARINQSASNWLLCSSQVLRQTNGGRRYWNVLTLHGSYPCHLQEHPIMSTQIHTQDAIRTLTNAFAPMNCLIMAARKGCFSFTLVNEHGIARHSERLYPDQYSSAEPLQAVIERTRQALVA